MASHNDLSAPQYTCFSDVSVILNDLRKILYLLTLLQLSTLLFYGFSFWCIVPEERLLSSAAKITVSLVSDQQHNQRNEVGFPDTAIICCF
jgi:hypothetical protein